ncbi:hypothetical protein [Methanosphaera cuniculi]|nr:hypothetical protein [Methanosphaera cuniculi]
MQIQDQQVLKTIYLIDHKELVVFQVINYKHLTLLTIHLIQ